MYKVEDVKRELNKIPALNRLIDIYIKRLDRYKGDLSTVRATSFDGFKSSPTNKTSDPTGDLVDILMDEEESINTNIDQLVDCKAWWSELICELVPEQRVIIELRYFDDLDWVDVALESHYSKTKVHQIHGQALVDLTDLINRKGIRFEGVNKNEQK